MRKTRSQTQKSRENDEIEANSTCHAPIVNGNAQTKPTATVKVRDFVLYENRSIY